MAIDTQQSIFSEVADFLVSQPTLEEIIAYRVPPPVQQYIDDLLEKNREEELAPEARLEMEKNPGRFPFNVPRQSQSTPQINHEPLNLVLGLTIIF
ncbi:MAG: hypothetical protein U0694_24935 [Anaerolineae bacterium]